MKSIIVIFAVLTGLSINLGAVNSSGESAAVELNREVLESQLGRRLKLSERILVHVVNKQARAQAKAANKPSDRNREKSSVGPNKTLAILGFVFGLTAIALGWIVPFVGLLLIPGLILSIIALNKANRYPDEYGGRGLAIAGVAINGAGLVLIFGIALAYII